MKTSLGAVRKSVGMTQQDVADAIGVPVSTYRKWEQGVNEPDLSIVITLAGLLGVTTDTILGSDLSEDIDGVRRIRPRPATRRVPVLGRIAAGTPAEAIPQSDESWWLFDPTLTDRDGLFYLRVSGDSMDTLFPDGALVLVDPSAPARSGDVAAVFVNGDDATVKRVFFAGDTIVLHPESHNPVHRDRSIDSTDPDSPEVRIAGRIVGFTSPEGWRG